MTIPQPPNPENIDHLEFVVMAPNDNTDGRDCACGHAKTDHGLVKQPDASEPPTWRCMHCTCTRAYPARIPSST